MAFKFSLWTFLTTALCLVAPSMGEIQPHSMTPESISEEKEADYVFLPQFLALAMKRQENGHKALLNHQKLYRLLHLLEKNNVRGVDTKHLQKKRKFPEIDSRGFDEDIFDEGFGDWSPMKRW